MKPPKLITRTELRKQLSLRDNLIASLKSELAERKAQPTASTPSAVSDEDAKVIAHYQTLEPGAERRAYRQQHPTVFGA